MNDTVNPTATMNRPGSFEAFQACIGDATARLGGHAFARCVVARYAGRVLNRLVHERLVKQQDFRFALNLMSSEYSMAEPADFTAAIASVERYIRPRADGPDHDGCSGEVLARVPLAEGGDLVLRENSLRFATASAEILFAHAYPDTVVPRARGEQRWAIALDGDAIIYLDLTGRTAPPTSMSHAKSLAGATRSLRRMASVLGVEFAETKQQEPACV